MDLHGAGYHSSSAGPTAFYLQVLEGRKGEPLRPLYTSSAVLTLEESVFDLLFIKVCILNALLGPKCWEGR